MNEDAIEVLKKAVLDGDEDTAKKAAEQIVKSGLDPIEIIQKHISPTLKLVGEKYECGEFFLTNLMLSAEAVKSVTSILLSKVSGAKSIEKAGKVVIGTVAGDIHDIGKNIVSLLLQVSGFDVSDLGSDVVSMKFLEGAERFNADVVGLSALMSTTRTAQKEFLDLLEGLKKRVNYQVIVGGGATTKEWSHDIGADGYAEDAVQAPKLVTKLIANRKTIKA